MITISKVEFLRLIRNVKEKYGFGFSKEYREMEEEKLFSDVKKYMKEFDMLREKEDTNELIIMPICFKILGKYPKDAVWKINGKYTLK